MEVNITEIICSVITAVSAIIVAYVTYKYKKQQKDLERHEMNRRKEAILSLEMAMATLELSIVCANALTGGHNNGNVEAARKRAIAAEEKYKQFEREILADEIS